MKKRHLLSVMAAVVTIFGNNGVSFLGGEQVFGMNLAQDRGGNAQGQVPNLSDLPDEIQTGFGEALSFADAVDRNVYGIFAGVTHGALVIFDYLILHRTNSRVMLDGRNAIAFLAHSLGIDLFNRRGFEFTTAQDDAAGDIVLRVLNRMVSYTLSEAYQQLGGTTNMGSGNDFGRALHLLAGFVNFCDMGDLTAGEAWVAAQSLPRVTRDWQTRLGWAVQHMWGGKIQKQREGADNTETGNDVTGGRLTAGTEMDLGLGREDQEHGRPDGNIDLEEEEEEGSDDEMGMNLIDLEEDEEDGSGDEMGMNLGLGRENQEHGRPDGNVEQEVGRSDSDMELEEEEEEEGEEDRSDDGMATNLVSDGENQEHGRSDSDVEQGVGRSDSDMDLQNEGKDSSDDDRG